MMKRYVYTLLFLVPGFFASVLIIGMLSGVVLGALWLFVYGDSEWPAWTESTLSAVLIFAFFTLWIGIAVRGYFTGRHLESSPGFDFRHIGISLVASIVPIVLIALHQLGVGNIGPKTDTERCIEYCLELGYQGSGMTPEIAGQRNCYCVGPRGETEASVPIDQLLR